MTVTCLFPTATTDPMLDKLPFDDVPPLEDLHDVSLVSLPDAPSGAPDERELEVPPSAMELLQTEERFSLDMAQLVCAFLDPMLCAARESPRVGFADRVVLENIRRIAAQLAALAKALADAATRESTSLPTLARAFARGLVAMDKAHVDYAREYRKLIPGTWQTLLAKCPELQDLAETTSVRGQKFESYLIRPLQRVCKYPLLVRAIAGVCAPAHLDAVAEFEQVATQLAARVDEAVAEGDDKARVRIQLRGLDVPLLCVSLAVPRTSTAQMISRHLVAHIARKVPTFDDNPERQVVLYAVRGGGVRRGGSRIKEIPLAPFSRPLIDTTDGEETILVGGDAPSPANSRRGSADETEQPDCVMYSNSVFGNADARADINSVVVAVPARKRTASEGAGSKRERRFSVGRSFRR